MNKLNEQKEFQFKNKMQFEAQKEVKLQKKRNYKQLKE